MNLASTHKGFIALTSVLVLGALFLALSIGLTTSSLFATERNISIQLSSVAEGYMEACGEYALMRISRELHYLGNETVSVNGAECEIFPFTEDSDGTRTVHIESIVSGYVRRAIIEISEISPVVVISAYKQISEF